MLTQTSVLARPGWSKGVLAQLLGEPDLRKKVFGRTSLSALYLESRVVAAENSDATNHYKQVLLIGNPLPPKPL